MHMMTDEEWSAWWDREEEKRRYALSLGRVHHPSCPARHEPQSVDDVLDDAAGIDRCICPKPDEVAADLVETDEEVPVEVDGPEYEYACIGSIVCEPLVDDHGRECERVNQEARVDFYDEVAASRFGILGWMTGR